MHALGVEEDVGVKVNDDVVVEVVVAVIDELLVPVPVDDDVREMLIVEVAVEVAEFWAATAANMLRNHWGRIEVPELRVRSFAV